MTQAQPTLNERVARAVAERNMAGLLLGEADYAFLPPGSPSPGKTDLALVLSALYALAHSGEGDDVRRQVEDALHVLLLGRGGEELGAVAYVLLFEALRTRRGDHALGLPSHEIAAQLSMQIQRHASTLAADRSGAGANWPNGWVGELQRLSRLTVEVGGPGFAGPAQAT
ncbi:MAG: hypothetical protein ACK4YQ_10140 [Phenylobacterium sp.]|uniref:hypothetical protein n=1 Tax=Phenylobacterium sp. TaxID=1871053 RepID=UPI00391A7BD1